MPVLTSIFVQLYAIPHKDNRNSSNLRNKYKYEASVGEAMQANRILNMQMILSDTYEELLFSNKLP